VADQIAHQNIDDVIVDGNFFLKARHLCRMLRV
jgi:hypothetical protein